MTRKTARSVSALALVALISTALSGCITPFSTHADDVYEAWGRKAHQMHRQYDRYILGFDWDDPYQDWHDESYATGPNPRH